jgi:hypothetical protein
MGLLYISNARLGTRNWSVSSLYTEKMGNQTGIGLDNFWGAIHFGGDI